MDISIVKEFKNSELSLDDIKGILMILDGLSKKDFKVIYDRLSKSNFEKEFVRIVCVCKKYRSVNDIIKLIDKYESLEYNQNVYKIIMSENACKHRTLNQQLIMMEMVSKFEDRVNTLVEILLDENVLKNRTFREQFKLVQWFSSFDCKEYMEHLVKELIVKRNILENRSYVEQSKMLTIYKNSGLNGSVHSVLTNVNVLDTRSFEEQKRLIDKLKESNYNQFVVNIIYSDDVLSNVDIETQLKLMDTMNEWLVNGGSALDANKVLNFLTNESVLLMCQKLNLNVKRYIEILDENDFNDKVLKILTNRNVLETRKLEEIKLLIDKVKKYGYNSKSIMIVTDWSILTNRNFEELLMLLDKVNSYDYNPDILQLFIDDTLNRRMIKEHFGVIDKYTMSEISKKEEKISYSFMEALSEIRSLEDLEELINLVHKYVDTKEFIIQSNSLKRILDNHELSF